MIGNNAFLDLNEKVKDGRQILNGNGTNMSYLPSLHYMFALNNNSHVLINNAL